MHFHFTSTHSSWPNMLEVWLSILSRQTLRPLSVTSSLQLRKTVDRCVEVYSETATPIMDECNSHTFSPATQLRGLELMNTGVLSYKYVAL